MSLSKDMRRKYAIINALSTLEKPSLRDLQHRTQIPESTLKRQLKLLRAEFAMSILFVREANGVPGASGYYLLTDWGILDRSAFMRNFGAI